MYSKAAIRCWEKVEDLATPEERALLDDWAEKVQGFPRRSRTKVTGRGDGGRLFVTIPYSGIVCGVIVLRVDELREEIHQAEEEMERKVMNNLGAGI